MLVVNVDEPGLYRSRIAYDVLLVYDIVLRLFMLVSRRVSKMYSRLTHYEIQRRVNALVGASSSNGTGCHSEQRYAWNSLALMVSTVGDECTGRREDDALLHFYSFQSVHNLANAMSDTALALPTSHCDHLDAPPMPTPYGNFVVEFSTVQASITASLPSNPSVSNLFVTIAILLTTGTAHPTA